MIKTDKILFKKINAFNLQELLVVLMIIGILILLALPNLMPLISKAKSIEAQTNLTQLYNMQRSYFFMHSKYSNDLNTIDFVAPKKVSEGGRSNYSYQVIEATNSSFKAKATAITDFDGDGILNTWQIDQDQNLKELIKD